MYRATMVCMTFLALFSGCSHDKAADAACQGCSNAVSFRTEIIPIFKASCAIAGGCHTGTAAADGLRLDSAYAYTQVTASGSFLIAGNPNASILYSQLLAGSSNHMPQNGVQLDPCTIQKVYCWIEQGAQNN